jgi:hypothetical protein
MTIQTEIDKKKSLKAGSNPVTAKQLTARPVILIIAIS